MQEWWSLQDPTLQAAIVTASATCAAAVLGFTAVFVQIGRQAKNAIRANRQNEALKRQVTIYEKTLEVSNNAQRAGSALSTYLLSFETSLTYARLTAELGQPIQMPSARFPEYQKLGIEASSAFIAVMTMVEEWRIVAPKLDLFRRAIAVGMDELHDVTMRYPNALVYGMPVAGFENRWREPTDEQAEAIKVRIAQENYQVGRLSAWVGEFQTEMQLLLLKELFPNEIPRREPPDPEQICIRLDRYSEVDSWLRATKWEQRATEFEAAAWADYSNSG